MKNIFRRYKIVENTLQNGDVFYTFKNMFTRRLLKCITSEKLHDHCFPARSYEPWGWHKFLIGTEDLDIAKDVVEFINNGGKILTCDRDYININRPLFCWKYPRKKRPDFAKYICSFEYKDLMKKVNYWKGLNLVTQKRILK